MGLYKKAAKNNYTFKSPVGRVNVSDLFSMKVEVLDKMWVDLSSLADTHTKSLLGASKIDDEAADKLEILKDIVTDKLAEKQAKLDANAKADKKRKLLEILARKQDASMEAKTEAEILAELQALDA